MNTLLVVTALLFTQSSVAVQAPKGPEGNEVSLVQLSYVKLSGHVSGPQKGPLQVTLFNPLGSPLRVDSRADGSFEFLRVPRGSYTLSAPGFAPVSVTAAEDLNIDLVPLYAGPGFTVSGNVIDKSARPDQKVARTVTLTPAGPGSVTASRAGETVSSLGGTIGASFGDTLETAVRADGSFEFPAVPAGPYVLRALPYAPGTKSVRVDITGNAHDLQVVIPFQIEVTGRVLLEGRQLGQNATVQAVQPTFSSATGIQKDGTFKLRLTEGESQISLTRLPIEFSVRRITFGKTDITNTPVKIDPTTAAQQILITLDTVSLDTNPGLTGSARMTTTVRPTLPAAAEISLTPMGTGPMRLGAEVRGRVRVIDAKGQPVPIRPAVGMSFRAADDSSVWTSLDPDGTFEVPLDEKQYRPTVAGLPEGYSIKSMSSGGIDLLKNPLIIDWKKMPAQIEVVLEYRPSLKP